MFKLFSSEEKVQESSSDEKESLFDDLLKHSFRNFDREGKGYLLINDIINVVKENSNDTESIEVLLNHFSMADSDKSGSLEFAEFRQSVIELFSELSDLEKITLEKKNAYEQRLVSKKLKEDQEKEEIEEARQLEQGILHNLQ